MTFDEYVQAVDESAREQFPRLELVMANRPPDRWGCVAWRRKTDAETAAGQAVPAVRCVEIDGGKVAFLFFGSDWLRPDASLWANQSRDTVVPMAEEIGRLLSA